MLYFDNEDNNCRGLLMWVLGISIRGTGRRLHILNGMFRFESNNRREMCQSFLSRWTVGAFITVITWQKNSKRRLGNEKDRKPPISGPSKVWLYLIEAYASQKLFRICLKVPRNRADGLRKLCRSFLRNKFSHWLNRTFEWATI